MRLFFIMILMLILLVINYQIKSFENFNQYYQTFQSVMPINTYKYPYAIPYLNSYTNFPWWNTQIGMKTNMSYDLRGDPIIIPRNNFMWLNSSISPIYNKSI